MLVRDPRDIAVSQYFQWKYRMRPLKKMLNDYPAHGADVSIFDFVMNPDVGLPEIIAFLEMWERELPRVAGSLVVRYEDMRADPEERARGACSRSSARPAAMRRSGTRSPTPPTTI